MPLPIIAVGPALVRTLPILFVAVALTPAWLVWPILPIARQRATLDLVQCLTSWTSSTHRPTHRTARDEPTPSSLRPESNRGERDHNAPLCH